MLKNPIRKVSPLLVIALAGAVGAATVLTMAVISWAQDDSGERRQERLQPFYETPAGLDDAKPGTVLRRERMNIEVPSGGTAERILYRSQRADGSPSVSSGMIFRPSAGGAGDRPVVAWAHGTIGLGDACAPSRNPEPLADMDWLGGMLKRGWIVAATDYAGLGTEGSSRYLLGRDEAHDVLNSVRAAREIDRRADTRFALWGHSQGGHSVLWSAGEAGRYAPELRLIAVAAAAPAAELVPLFSGQADSAAAWAIGSDVVTTWPSEYPALNIDGVVTERGRDSAEKLAGECIGRSGLEALVRGKLGEPFFTMNPMQDRTWRAAAEEQTPLPTARELPLLVVQSLSDQVVLPDTTARLTRSWCNAGSNLRMLWIDQVPHQSEAIVSGPTVTGWLGERFAGEPADSSCGDPLPIAPSGAGK